MKSKNKLILLFAFIFTLLLSSCGTQKSKTPPEPIPDWNQYEVNNITFQLPDTYKDDTEWYKENYPDESINTIVFFTTSNESKNAIQNVFIVNKIEMDGRVDFDEYIDGYVDYISTVYEVTSHSKIDDIYPTEKIFLAAENEYEQSTGLTYVTYIGSSIYLIEFQCGADLFDQYESEFQTIFKNVYIP
jgi:hypothetical protein